MTNEPTKPAPPAEAAPVKAAAAPDAAGQVDHLFGNAGCPAAVAERL
jgi:hypothetical protein